MVLLMLLAAANWYVNNRDTTSTPEDSVTSSAQADLASQTWDGSLDNIAMTVANNEADFNDETLREGLSLDTWMRTEGFDHLGRTQGADALISKTGVQQTRQVQRPSFLRTMQPSGWFLNSEFDPQKQEWRRTKSNNRPIYIDGQQKTVYSRGHLIAWQLGGGYQWEGWRNGNYSNQQLMRANQREANGWEANMTTQNLTTSAMDQNDPGMTTYEMQIANVVRDEGVHVRYRVTPIYRGDELVPRGNHVMAKSVEDNGDSLNFNVYIFNVMRDTRIDYTTGQTYQEGE